MPEGEETYDRNHAHSPRQLEGGLFERRNSPHVALCQCVRAHSDDAGTHTKSSYRSAQPDQTLEQTEQPDTSRAN
jgi:hypothetical protein